MQFDNYSIRLLKESDLGPYYDMVQKNRARLEDFFTGTTSRTATFEDTKVFLSEIVEKAANRQYFPYIIIENSTNTIVGFLDLKNIDWSIPKSEMGLYIDEAYASKGISTKAFLIFQDYCFKTYGFKKLFLRTHSKNYAARKIAEHAGFEIEGTIRRDYITTSGELVDLIYYGKLG